MIVDLQNAVKKLTTDLEAIRQEREQWVAAAADQAIRRASTYNNSRKHSQK